MGDRFGRKLTVVGDALSVAVILFAVFSCAGWLYETADNAVTFGGFYLRTSLMFPWCPIYGIGGLEIIGVMEPVRRFLEKRLPFYVQIAFVFAGVYMVASIVELAGSYACEAAMGYVPWDYSGAWLNFDGRIAPAYTLRFVLMGLLALYVMYPRVLGWVTRNPMAARTAAVVVLFLLLADCTCEWLGVWGELKGKLVRFGVQHW